MMCACAASSGQGSGTLFDQDVGTLSLRSFGGSCSGAELDGLLDYILCD